MSARDTKRDLAPGPSDTLRDLPHVEREPDDATATQEVATREVPAQHGDSAEEKTGARKKFDPYRFQTNTVPPGMRAELLGAEPEEHPSDLMQDTVPPNRAAARATRESLLEGTDDSGIHRAVRRPGLRPLALVSLSLAAIALSVLVIVAATRQHAPVREVTTLAPPSVTTAPSTVTTAPSTVTTAPSVTAPQPHAVTQPNVAAAPSVAPVGSGSSAPNERVLTPVVPRATTTPQKTAGPKSEPPAHGSRIHKGPDLESPLMP